MTITQLIYTSQPFGFDDAILNGILVGARRNNPALDITGCLICRHDMYLQLLEGPGDAIDALFAKIKMDDRHLVVAQLSRATVSARMFPDWAMRDDPAQSWLWPPEAVANGALFQASPDALRAVFARVAQ
jgi:NAD(P)-dependent dehydrogenase (short-subunit alcohol dehydrogenase family)